MKTLEINYPAEEKMQLCDSLLSEPEPYAINRLKAICEKKGITVIAVNEKIDACLYYREKHALFIGYAVSLQTIYNMIEAIEAAD